MPASSDQPDIRKIIDGVKYASPRFRTSLASPIVLADGVWSNIVLGGSSSLNTNEFSDDPKPIRWDATEGKIKFDAFEGEDVTNYMLQIDVALSAPVNPLVILGNAICPEPDEIWFRFNAPDAGGDLTFPLPDSLGRGKLGGFDRTDATSTHHIVYTVYANSFLRSRGLKLELMPIASRVITVTDVVLLAFPI